MADQDKGLNGHDDDFASMLESSFDYSYAPPRRGEIRTATILQIEDREIIVDLGAKQDGIVTYQDIERMDADFRHELQVGEEVPVYVLNPRDTNGNLIVSINMGLQRYDWEKAAKLLKSEEVVQVVVTGFNKGGVLVRWNRLEGFIPSSHLTSLAASADRREALSNLTGEQLGVKVIEVDQDRRRLIFSEREAQREWRQQQKARLLDELNEGDVVPGTVTGLRDFGAFVNIGGADGLIHVSELAWHRVDHPRDILSVGDKIDVYIFNLDRKTNRIALSRKRLLQDPWDTASTIYHEGQLVDGVVTNVVDFGAFVALDDGLEGLLHLSEMGDGSLKEPHSYVQKGDRLSLRISHLEPEKRRVGFTQRWGTEASTGEGDDAPPASGEAEAEGEVSDEAVPENDDVVEAGAEAQVEAEVEDVVEEEAQVEDTSEAEDVPEDAPEDDDASEEDDES